MFAVYAYVGRMIFLVCHILKMLLCRYCVRRLSICQALNFLLQRNSFYVYYMFSFVSGLTGLIAQRLSHYNPPALPFTFARK